MTSKQRGSLWLLLIAIASVVALFVKGMARSLTSHLPTTIECQSSIDLGTVPIGSFATASFTVTNGLPKPTRITSASPDCSCMEVYRLDGSTKYSIIGLEIDAGGCVKLHTDIRVDGEPGIRRVSSVSLQFSDSKLEHQCIIDYLPVARVYTIPQSVNFGSIFQGETGEKSVELLSDGSMTNTIINLSSSLPHLFDLEFQKPIDGLLYRQVPKGQSHLGTIVIKLRPHLKPGSLSTDLKIVSDGKDLVELTLSGKIVPDCEFRPSELFLPGIGSTGEVLLAEAIFFSANEASITTALAAPKLPFEVQILDVSERQQEKKVLITMKRHQLSEKRSRFLVPFEITIGGKTRNIALPVTVDSILEKSK